MNVFVTTKYVCGIDLHSKMMSVCIMDISGRVIKKKSLACGLPDLLELLSPFGKDITIGVESTYNWYWLVDGLDNFGYSVYLGHALYIKQMGGKKHKTDAVDARCIADLLRTNRFPIAYAYPPEMRSVRDLLRRRHFFVRQRSGAFTHMQNTFNQHGFFQSLRNDVQRRTTRRKLLDIYVNNDDFNLNIEADIFYTECLDKNIDKLESYIIRRARYHDNAHFALLQTIPGCGNITSLSVLYETHTIDRFPSPQCYSSYSRVIRATCESAGKYLGNARTSKIGNPYLKWSFSEIAASMINHSPFIHDWYEKQIVIHGKKGTQSRLRHRIATAVYFMLKNNIGFDEYRFSGMEKHGGITSANNWVDKAGQNNSEPLRLNGNSSSSPLTTILKREKKMSSKNKAAMKRLSLRTTGKRNVLH